MTSRCAPLLASLRHTLDSFVEIGLGYLSLDRPAGTLSGGEAQRVKMIRHLGSALTDVTYVFDEPTDRAASPRHRADERPSAAAARQGQHRAGRRARAGGDRDRRPRRRPRPRRRQAGGEVVFEGTVDALRKSDTITGRHLDDRAAIKDERASAVRCAAGTRRQYPQPAEYRRRHPAGVLVVLTGVAGSGKSSLIDDSVAGRDGVVTVDQAPIRGSRRSNPATYTGLLDPIRKAFAKANDVKPALFSANSEGACPTCNGAGVIYTELGVMATVESHLRGLRGQAVPGARCSSTHSGGRDIAEVLAMSVLDARDVLRRRRGGHPAAHKILDRLADVGLGYLSLGQPLTTLSGGERQRLKLATSWVTRPMFTSSTNRPGSAPRRRRSAARPAGPARRLGEVGDRHRAPSGGDGARRLDHRPRSWRGSRRRSGRLRGTTCRPHRRRATLTGEHLADYVGG